MKPPQTRRPMSALPVADELIDRSVAALNKRSVRREDVGERATCDADFEHAAVERCFGRVAMLERKLLTAGADRDHRTNE